jgi:hypothetical protein
VLIDNNNELVCELGVGNCTARVYETQRNTYEVAISYMGRQLEDVSEVRESIRHLPANTPLNATWEVMDGNRIITVTQKDVMDVIELVERTEDLVSSLENGLTPNEWYERFQQDREQTHVIGR